jgi:hypothetical protein
MRIISFDKRGKFLYPGSGGEDGLAGSEDRCRSLKSGIQLDDFHPDLEDIAVMMDQPLTPNQERGKVWKCC